MYPLMHGFPQPCDSVGAQAPSPISRDIRGFGGRNRLGGYTYVFSRLSLRSGETMQRRPTSFDIAALAGVSQPTVSRALNNSPSVSAETRARVLAAAEQLNYKVDKNASGLRRSRSRTLALLFEEASADGGLINPFYLSMLGSMVRRGAKRLLSASRSAARAKVSSLTIAGTGISIHSSRGRS